MKQRHGGPGRGLWPGLGVFIYADAVFVNQGEGRIDAFASFLSQKPISGTLFHVGLICPHHRG